EQSSRAAISVENRDRDHLSTLQQEVVEERFHEKFHTSAKEAPPTRRPQSKKINKLEQRLVQQYTTNFGSRMIKIVNKCITSGLQH
ncbi:hypothetical protein Nepgr_025325, partial [Nepenthes gracilis]